jgi:tripartite-type tricarboxylate transporter receptor subunit TctC
MELLKAKAGIDLTHVPYRGNGPAITDLLAGRVQAMFTGMPPVAEHVREGRLKLLASSGSKRMAAAPNLATIVEQGVPGYEVLTWFGVLAPVGAPPALVQRVNQSLRDVMAQPETAERLASLGADLAVDTPAHFASVLEKELQVWGEVVRASNARAE